MYIFFFFINILSKWTPDKFEHNSGLNLHSLLIVGLSCPLMFLRRVRSFMVRKFGSTRGICQKECMFGRGPPYYPKAR